MALEESDEGRWRVVEAVDDVFFVLEASIFDPTGDSCPGDFVLQFEVVDQESFDPGTIASEDS